VSEILGRQIGFCLHHAFTDILLVHNPVAIKNRVGLMADNLFRHLARDPSPVHISRCSSARIV
jgi:hypothetical protein